MKLIQLKTNRYFCKNNKIMLQIKERIILLREAMKKQEFRLASFPVPIRMPVNIFRNIGKNGYGFQDLRDLPGRLL